LVTDRSQIVQSGETGLEVGEDGRLGDEAMIADLVLCLEATDPRLRG